MTDPGTGAPEFWTLLGPDFSGKSTVLGGLRGWHVVSQDDRYLERHPLIRRLRHDWVADLWTDDRYSAELVLSVAHTVMLHLRDELLQAATPDAGRDKIIVDSYYYKLLAKCRLQGLEHRPTFDLWRSFPRPRGVIYLDVPPEVAWARTDHGAKLNSFEHNGDTASEAGFASLQARLRSAVLTEVGDVPVEFVDGSAPPDTVMANVLAVLEMAAAQ